MKLDMASQQARSLYGERAHNIALILIFDNFIC